MGSNHVFSTYFLFLKCSQDAYPDVLIHIAVKFISNGHILILSRTNSVFPSEISVRCTRQICFQSAYVQFKFACFGRDKAGPLRPNDKGSVAVKGVPLSRRTDNDQVVKSEFRIPGPKKINVSYVSTKYEKTGNFPWFI